ncbi:MAG: transposase [Streptococcus sp.]|jgi:transposase|nr:transposase [Streptococcus sp.]
MDNCAIHLTEKIQNFFEKTGIVCITLPQYTPEFNPIEKYFRMVKSKMSYSN